MLKFVCLCRETIPSGALTLDIALGGGFPKGRIIEVNRLHSILQK